MLNKNNILIAVMLFISFYNKILAQQSLPDVIVKRIQISDPDISKKQSFYYKRKEEFHQVLVRDLGERTGKFAPTAFYVDFLAEKEKVKGDYYVEVRWVNLVFYNGQAQVRRTPTGTVVIQKQPETGTFRNVSVEEDEYRFIYPVDAVLELLIYKKEKDSLKIAYEMSEPVQYRYETKPTRTSMIPNAPTPDKPIIFKELSLSYYTIIKKAILNYFNGKE